MKSETFCCLKLADGFQLCIQVYVFKREAVSDSQKFVWTSSGLEEGVQVIANMCMKSSFQLGLEISGKTYV